MASESPEARRRSFDPAWNFSTSAWGCCVVTRDVISGLNNTVAVCHILYRHVSRITDVLLGGKRPLPSICFIPLIWDQLIMARSGSTQGCPGWMRQQETVAVTMA